LSARYRDPDPGAPGGPLSETERLAYVVTRMPATRAALAIVLSELSAREPRPVASVLDLGTGPGTSLWADASLPSLEQATLVDADAAMLALGERLWRHHPRQATLRVRWERARLGQPGGWAPHDLVLLSYVLGELPPDVGSSLLTRAREAGRLGIAIVEPGTPRGFARVIAARDALIAAGWHTLAPCPHDAPCPWRATAAGDWCHFAARLGRSRLHRQMKGGDLGWEDEKFSYVVALRPPVAPARAAGRVVRHPIKGTGHVKLTLCTRDGIVERTVTRKDREAYRGARDVVWGDGWSTHPPPVE
jgi:ribosomal protein RSM22 (predicted rRNA methylase)